MRQLPIGDNSLLSTAKRELPDRDGLSPISIQIKMFSLTAIKMRILSIQIVWDFLTLSCRYYLYK